jgi:hypothetical protein
MVGPEVFPMMVSKGASVLKVARVGEGSTLKLICCAPAVTGAAAARKAARLQRTIQ